MTINGKARELPGQIILSELLCLEGFQAERVAVELNGQIVPKPAYGATLVSGEDKLEIVSFVGGG